ncbi:MAG: nicotinate mononucleotide-dependent phosphoribosyltransferase CobT [Candidatus Jordarchaeum sp.]|uniref:nicotinate mononucleotide-dependent phosphoribosyltransferase CobT n=1 Tax=Candidatus Jordarchaeum sp. TaxID=2823881 RepID=UPI00404B4DD8
MRKYEDILIAHRERKARNFLDKIENQKPVFVCTIGNTETAKIPEISAAGKYPEITDYTPAADVELLFYGECRCIEGVPVTPDGIPTPALITRSALNLADIPFFAVSGGLRVKPHAPFIDLEGEPGEDIRTGKAVKNAEEVTKRAEIVGRNFSKIADYLVVGESIPGGTTTALGVLLAMGVDAKLKVSSSMPVNPHSLKISVAEEGLKAAGVRLGDLRNDPINAVASVGDPMIAAFSGLVIGAASKIPVLMAGGTQMTAILSVVKALKAEVLENVAIGTTRWIVEDVSSDIKGIVSQISDVPILAANLNFSSSKIEGLKAYERGVVKEGVGAGGISIAIFLKTRGKITSETLLKEIEENYKKLMK